MAPPKQLIVSLWTLIRIVLIVWGLAVGEPRVIVLAAASIAAEQLLTCILNGVPTWLFVLLLLVGSGLGIAALVVLVW